MFVWIYYNRVCFVNEKFASFLLTKSSRRKLQPTYKPTNIYKKDQIYIYRNSMS